MRLSLRTPLVLILVLFLAASASGKVLMDEDFRQYEKGSAGTPTWKVQAGEWQVTDRGFTGADCPGGFTAQGAKAGEEGWADYTLTVRFKVLSLGTDWKDGAWIGFRHKNPKNAYTLGFYRGRTFLNKISGGRMTGRENPLAMTGRSVREGRWHTVKIHAVGRKIAVYVDGKLLLAAEDNDWNDSPPLESGGIVLGARRWPQAEGTTEVLFSRVKVETDGALPEKAIEFIREKQEKRARRRRVAAFVESQRKRNWSDAKRRVMALYEPGFGTPRVSGEWSGWRGVDEDQKTIENCAHFPAGGPYDTTDSQVLKRQIELARNSGIDGFVSGWDGADTRSDRVLEALLAAAAEEDFTVAARWRSMPGEPSHRWEAAVQSMAHLVGTAGEHPAYLKVDGRPVIFLSGAVMEQVKWHEWSEIVPEARRRTEADFLLIADGHSEDYARVFDGVRTFGNPAGWLAGKSPAEMKAAAARRYGRVTELAATYGKISCVTVIPGYKEADPEGPTVTVERRDGALYEKLWGRAVAGEPDWILISSWNDWRAGSQIEPAMSYNDMYLDLTRRFVRRLAR